MNKESNKNESKSSTRHRSPGFPNIPLEEAISRLKIIYQHDKRAFTTVEAIITHLGYKGGRGGSAGRAVAALKHYGLLEEKSGQFRVSDIGFKLLHFSEDSEEKKELLKEISLYPSTFKRIFSYYEGEIPSDTTLRQHLIFKEKFNPESVDQFIRVFRQTISFANPTLDINENADNSNDVKNEEIEAQPSIQTTQIENASSTISQPQNSQSQISLSPYSNGETLKFRISRDSEVIVTFSGQVTQGSIEKLKILLEATKDTYPTQEELEQPRSAIWKNKDYNLPVKVMSELGQGSDGKNYVKIEDSETGVPVDELDFGEN